MLSAIREETALILGDLIQLAALLGAQPELGYQEVFAAESLAQLLERHGHAVHQQYLGIDTSIRSGAEQPSGGSIAFLAEYDALPGLGHACGHNIIAAAAAGAFLVMSKLFVGENFALIGCPAEESVVNGAGGKIRLLAGGAFDDVRASLMVHPYSHDAIIRDGSLYAQTLTFEFLGKSSHASMAPHLGNNAVDAAVQLYLGFEFLKAKLAVGQQLQAVISDGGKTPNVIPDRSELKVRFRGSTAEEFSQLKSQIIDVAESIASLTRTTLSIAEFTPVYMSMIQDPLLYEDASDAFADLGIEDFANELKFGSTDFGNISHSIPAVEIGIGLGEGLTPHTKEFEQAATSADAADAIARGVVLMCLTAAKYSARIHITN